MEKRAVGILTQEYKKGATWNYCSSLAAVLAKNNLWDPYIVAAKRENDNEEKARSFSLNLVKTSSSKLFYSQSFWKKSRREIRKINPSIVHGNMNLLSSLGIKDEFPIVETVHTTFSRERKGAKEEPIRSLSWVEKRVLFLYPLLKRVETKLLRRANHLIAVSDVIKNELITEYSIDEDKITVIPNGVDVKNYHPTNNKTYEKKDDELVLGFLGRMTASKGARLLFLVLREVKNRHKDVKLLLAGDDLNTKKEIIKIIRKYGLSENVIELGYISDVKKKIEFLNSLDLFLLPSSHEGMNLTLLEALACQIPIMATPQAVTFDHNDTIIIAQRNKEDFSNKIIDFYNNPQISNTIKRKSLDIITNYSWENTAKFTQEVYEKILS